MLTVRTAPRLALRIVSRLRVPCAALTTRAPSTPTADASEGLANPPYIEPSTARIRNTTGPRCRRPTTLSAKLMFSDSSGATAGFTVARNPSHAM